MAAGKENITIRGGGGNGTLLEAAIVAGAATAGYFFIVKPWWDEKKAASDLKRDQSSTIKPAKGKVLKDLTGKPTSGANLATIADDLENALSWPVDQGRVIRVFQSTPWGYVPQLEKIFLDKFGKPDLRKRLADKLSDANWIKIKFNFQQ